MTDDDFSSHAYEEGYRAYECGGGPNPYDSQSERGHERVNYDRWMLGWDSAEADHRGY